jgi:hypothetical protein
MKLYMHTIECNLKRLLDFLLFDSLQLLGQATLLLRVPRFTVSEWFSKQPPHFPRCGDRLWLSLHLSLVLQ